MDESNTKPTRWTLPVHEPRPRCKLDDLCVTCDKIWNWNLLTGPHYDARWDANDTSTDTDLPIGWADRLLATKYCASCQFFVKLLEKHDVHVEESTSQQRIFCRRRVGWENPRSAKGGLISLDLSVGFTSYRENQSDEDARTLVQIELPTSVYSVCLQDVATLSSLDSYYSDGESVLHSGRLVLGGISPDFIRESYQTCKAHHNAECVAPHFILRPRSVIERPDLSFLRVMDVPNRCLVSLPQGADYIALSYTWTNEAFTSLLSSNIDFLHTKNSIMEEALPPTIADAMMVVIHLGERYLWADRLCIIQDSATDMKTQIHQMDRVYQQSALTIVAAGENEHGRDSGLPGIRPGSRLVNQVSATVRGILFVETTPWVEELVTESRWDSRAWTFQEAAMSRRHLVFTPTRAGFSCRQEHFMEDYVRRTCFHQVARQQDAPFPCCTYEAPDSTDDVHASSINVPGVAFEPMLRSYTPRDMSVEGDVLKGMLGLLKTISAETGERFLCGLPIGYLFERYLLWLPRASSVRRGPNSQGQLFPSWSWAGWIGGVTFTVDPDMLDGKARDQAKFGDSLVQDFEIRIPSDDNTSQQLPPSDITDDTLLSLETCLLVFTAPAAIVKIGKPPWGSFSDCDDGPCGALSRCHQIFVEGSFAGMLLGHSERPHASELSRKLPNPPAEEDVVEGELVALSTAIETFAVSLPNNEYGADEANFRYIDARGEPKTHVPFDTDVWEDDYYDFIHVMLVDWHDGVAYRVGIGQIHGDAWEKVGAMRKNFVLG